ncbi:hypothetical protein [Pseudomonas brassicacearum]|uniref:hypothetical protein n=1 Tax=Pseudomonas brassicacearum TaxID=930166 RepID=UPI0021824937|nr:hypothetical protein [Pseudomonas brassicacearum]
MIAQHLDLIYLLSSGAVLLLILLSEAIVLFAAYFRLDQMEGHFIASHLVGINRKTLGNSPLGRMKRVRQIGALTGRITYFQMLDRYAVMEAEIFPEHLKKWVKFPRYLMRIALTGACLLLLLFGLERIFKTVSEPASDLKLLCMAALIACVVMALIALFVRTYVSFFKLAEIESFLTESYFVARNRRVLGNSAYGRLSRLSHISIILLLDHDFLSGSDPDAMNEIARFPLPVRRWVIIPARILGYSFLGYCVIYLGGALFGVFA